MPKMVEIVGLSKLLSNLQKTKESPQYANCSVAVGYTAFYALYVHENREIWPPGMRLLGKARPGNRGEYWDPQPGARPQFLLEATREGEETMKSLVTDSAHRGLPLVQCLYIAGLWLQRTSQQRVPVDTGNLKASAFTKIEEQG